MKVVCVGAGPAGLYLSILLKLRDRDCDVSVLERNAAGWTEGWGIISGGNDLVRQMRVCDPVSASTFLAHSTRWTGQLLHLQGRTTLYRPSFGYSISRNRFVEILSARAAELGVELHYQSEVASLDRFAAADLIVASDGAGSMIRDEARDAFGTKIRHGRNKYIWLGTTKVLDYFTFAIEKTDAGWIWFHGYPHGKDMSTCVVECSPQTWSSLGFDSMDTESSIRVLEGVFADVLEGGDLVGGVSTWRNFRTITNRTWHQGNVVLAGDAAHTTHFSLDLRSRTPFLFLGPCSCTTMLSRHLRPMKRSECVRFADFNRTPDTARTGSRISSATLACPTVSSSCCSAIDALRSWLESHHACIAGSMGSR